MAQAAATMKRCSMELGGKCALHRVDDADIDRAVAGAMLAKYRNAGQTCVCTNRFYVQAGVHDLFAEKLAKAVSEVKVGNGLENGVQVGPMIDIRRSRRREHTSPMPPPRAAPSSPAASATSSAAPSSSRPW